MAIIKCKMCGGDLNITEGMSIAECEYCGTKQTVPNVDNEKKVTLFGRANRLRLACEFDKAASVYESIVAEFSEEAEAYWGLVLCRYGIEYVDDPATGKKVPTCHRSSFESILEDTDFEQACENADTVARKVYREEAKAIEEIRKGILEVSGKELPYDIFICYKETDENGERTVDSVLAQDVYDSLVEKGYRVFFSRITLEDKLGTEYEPYIFAALNSAKVMLVFGTDYEYFNAVWVKNEWSRFLKLMDHDKSKHLIPCYKDVDAYDMPKEFQKLQAQDMGKVGAVQDLLRGIAKLLGNGQAADPVKETVVVRQTAGVTVDSLLQRGQLFLEDGNWKDADAYFDKVLDINPECTEAYIGKICAERECTNVSDLEHQSKLLSDSPNYNKIIRFGDAKLIKLMEQSNQIIYQRLEEVRIQREAEHNQQMEVRRKHENEIAQHEQMLQLRRLLSSKAQKCIAAGDKYTVGVSTDGTLVETGVIWKAGKSTKGWTDIAAVAGGSVHVVGLKTDSTVVAAGCNIMGQCKSVNWTEIAAIACSYCLTAGLRKNGGTIVTKGNNLYGQRNIENWTNMSAIACGDFHTVGLKADGTLVAVGHNPYNEYGQCDIGDWTEIVAIACGSCHTVGLECDGTVIAVGKNEYGQCNVEEWADIVCIACGGSILNGHTVGVKADGTVVATGSNKYGQCNVEEWRDIVAVVCGDKHTVGLKSDGTLVAVGSNENGQRNVQNWRLFQNIETIETERVEAKERRYSALEAECDSLRAQLPTLKGMFAGGKRRRLEERLAEIEAELKKLQ